MPQSQARRLAWTGAAQAAGRRWRSYTALLGFAAVAGTVVACVPQLSGHEGYAGAVLGGVAALVVLSLIGLTNPAQDGRLAEQWNLQGLRRVRGWHVTDNLPFEREDVDHVVIAPSAVLAVESKYRGPSFPAAGAAAERHARDLAAAERAAQKVRLLMRAERCEQFSSTASVEPVLVVSGPGSPELPTGYRLEDGVHVVDGDHPERWMHVFSAPRLPAAARRDLHTAFQLFAATAHDGETLPPLRSHLWRELRAGIATERAERSARRRRGSDAAVPAVGTNPGDAPHALIA